MRIPATNEYPEGRIAKICLLASSSAGNATFIAAGRTRILVDAGLSRRETAARLAGIGEDINRLDAILITHEHTDHVAGLAQLVKRGPIPVYVSALTASALDWGGVEPRLETFQAGSAFAVGDIAVESFTVPHDAVDPVGFCFRLEGRRLGMVTDLGYIPDSIRIHLRGTDFLVLESNHNLEMLKVGPYPWAVKQRVMGRRGHLSNDLVGEYIVESLDEAVKTLVLAHLSETNNHPELARLVSAQALGARGLQTRLVVAEPRKQTEVFEL